MRSMVTNKVVNHACGADCNRIRRRSVKLTIILSLLALSQFSFACSCEQRSLKEYYDAASKVFIGKLVSASRDGKSVLHISVSEAFKGRVSAFELVITGDGNGDCGLGVDESSEYLFYLDEMGKADICGGSVRASAKVIWDLVGGATKISNEINSNRVEQLRKITASNKPLKKDAEKRAF